MRPSCTRRSALKVFAGTLASSAFSRFAAASAKPWNILFLLADDLGWHDTAPYGNTVIDTPNLTRLATESVRFTNAYAACPVCSPTRASILTGKYPAHLGLTDWIPGYKPSPYARLLTPPFLQQLPGDTPTLPAELGLSGYRSAMIGKWHLGGTGSLPTDRGFDENIGGSAAGSPKSYFGPLAIADLHLAPGEFLTQRLTTEGAAFLSKPSTKPYFLYESHYTVHEPLDAPADLIAKYRARNTGEIDPIYCAMVETLDTSVGQLLSSLDHSGQADRTIVVFFSDNGGLEFPGPSLRPVTRNTPLRGGKGFLYEGGIREPLLIRWPGVTHAGTILDQPVSSVDFMPTLIQIAGRTPPPSDGQSLVPLLQNRPFAERPLFWHYPHYHGAGGTPSGAVRLGEWKLLEFFEDGRLELFHLSSDPGEVRNLVLREPARTRSLHTTLRDWRASVQAAMPSPNPNYDPVRLVLPAGHMPPIPPLLART